MGKGARSVFEMKTKYLVGSEPLDAGAISAATSAFTDHVLLSKVEAHPISSITGLQTELNGLADSGALEAHTTGASVHSVDSIVGLSDALAGKQDSFSGFTGTLDVIVEVDFDAKSVVAKQLSIVNGVVTTVTLL